MGKIFLKMHKEKFWAQLLESLILFKLNQLFQVYVYFLKTAFHIFYLVHSWILCFMWNVVFGQTFHKTINQF